MDCLHTLEYFSSKKLVCLSGSAVGKGKIIVTTFSGGEGTSTVDFRGLEPPRVELLGRSEKSRCDEDNSQSSHVHTHAHTHTHTHTHTHMILCLQTQWKSRTCGRKRTLTPMHSWETGVWHHTRQLLGTRWPTQWAFPPARERGSLREATSTKYSLMGVSYKERIKLLAFTCSYISLNESFFLLPTPT